MALTRKPSISDARIGDRAAQTAVSNIRQRIEAIEALLLTIEGQANQSSFSLRQRNAALTNLQSQIDQLDDAFEVLEDLLASDDGIVVLTSGALITRELEAGTGISIDNADGVDGNPVINATASGECCYPFLTTELDDDILTEDGHRIRVE